MIFHCRVLGLYAHDLYKMQKKKPKKISGGKTSAQVTNQKLYGNFDSP